MSSKKHPPRAPRDEPRVTIPRGQSTLEPLPSLQVPMWIIELPEQKPPRPRESKPARQRFPPSPAIA
jgi:hypothetical protein